MRNDFMSAINQICSEKGLSRQVVIEAIEAALASAYRRTANSPSVQEIRVSIDPATGAVRVFTSKTIVETSQDKRTEISLAEALAINPEAALEGTVEIETTPTDFGRIAAQTAKQVVLQRLREAERDMIYGEFSEREGDILTGIVQRIESRGVVIELGKAEAVMPPSEQVPSERYRPGVRLKVYLLEVNRTSRGPQVIVSRTHKNLLKRLFELEVPEIYSGTIEIKAIAREPGARSKVAVISRQAGVDAVGSCVGMRGVRIQNVCSELYGEKIDVVNWNEDEALFVANALSPAQVTSVHLNEEDKTASVMVPERQLSLAIGKEGQNARLSARLTGWRIDIRPDGHQLVPESAGRTAEPMGTPGTAVEAGATSVAGATEIERTPVETAAADAAVAGTGISTEGPVDAKPKKRRARATVLASDAESIPTETQPEAKPKKRATRAVNPAADAASPAAEVQPTVKAKKRLTQATSPAVDTQIISAEAQPEVKPKKRTTRAAAPATEAASEAPDTEPAIKTRKRLTQAASLAVDTRSIHAEAQPEVKPKKRATRAAAPAAEATSTAPDTEPAVKTRKRRSPVTNPSADA